VRFLHSQKIKHELREERREVRLCELESDDGTRLKSMRLVEGKDPRSNQKVSYQVSHGVSKVT
jgi:hypothetical protein